ncbi:MAG: S1/P1 nuclease [Reichenbachiella sp.]
MKRTLLTLVSFLISIQLMAWGKTGHRVVGEIAYQHLSSKAKKNIQNVLGDEQLGMVGNYMDFIRSDRNNDFMTAWHYCTIPHGQTYVEVGAPEQGDAVEAIGRLIAELKSKQFTYEKELENLKYLVHLVGDIHQPMHVGNGTDKGGNEVKVEFMYEKSNLHRVWDSGLIDYQQLSYIEYVAWIDIATKEEEEKWQSDGISIWLEEAIGYREEIYDIPENNRLSYRYNYDHIGTVNERLLKGGIRLAGILNEIYR